MYPSHIRPIKMIKIFIDTETTGLSPVKNCVHQVAGLVVDNDEIVHEFDLKFRPRDGAEIEQGALDKSNLTVADLALRDLSYADGFRELRAIFADYIDPYNPREKAIFAAFRAQFDNVFLRAFWADNKDTYFGSWFWSGELDVSPLAMEYLGYRRATMPNFKLVSVAEELGLNVNISELHDALVDIKLTYEVYKIVTGRVLEI